MTLHDEIRDIQTDLRRLTGIDIRSNGLVDGPTLRAVRAVIRMAENGRTAAPGDEGPTTAGNGETAPVAHPGAPEGQIRGEEWR